MYPRSSTSLALRKAGVPVFGDIEAAACAISLPLVGRVREGVSESLLPPLGHLPPPLLGRVGEGGSKLPTDYFGVRRLLEDAGIPFAEARPATNEQEAVAAANGLGYPVVLKALGQSHKSDAGGVRLAIASEAALLEDFHDMQRRLQPPLFSVEREAPIELGVELLIGVKRDRSFGPIALVGLGGLHAEVFRDASVALAPITRDQAAVLIKSLHGAQLLTGWRNRPPLDIPAAAEALSKLSFVASNLDDVQEIEINPLLVLENGVLALDARLSRAD